MPPRKKRYMVKVVWLNGGPVCQLLANDMKDIELWMWHQRQTLAGIKAFVVKDATVPLAVTVHSVTLTQSWTLDFTEAIS